MPATSLSTSHHLVKRYLIAQNQEGCFPYYPGKTTSIESTAWCSIALRRMDAISKAVPAFLLNAQNADGGWSTEPKAKPSDWCSALALLAVALLDPDPLQNEMYLRGVDYLMNHRTELYTPLGRVVVFLTQGPTYARGWPWNPGCYHWAEPTSYSIQALHPAGAHGLKDVPEAISGARKALLEKACAAGGWNYGNNVMLGAQVPPFLLTTAQVLLSLQETPEHPAVRSAIAYLERAADEQTSVMTLAWMIMALDAFGRHTSKLLSNLLNRQTSEGSFGNNLLLTGLAACALCTGEKDNPLKLITSSNPPPKR